MRVLLAGASGTLGGPLVRELLAAGHQVTGITRTAGGAGRIAATGATPLIADVLDRDGLLGAVRGERFDAVIHELTALRKAPLRFRDMEGTNELRRSGSTHLLQAAEETGARRFVTQSIVFGYGFRRHGATPLTEDAPFGVAQNDAFDPTVTALASAEQQALHTDGVEGVALRYGLFYGADIATVAGMLRKRALPVTRSAGEIPFVHHEDAAAATVAALERGRAGAAYNIVDDTPATFPDLVRAIANSTGAPQPLTVPARVLRLVAPYGYALFGGMSMRVSNALAREELGWVPRYPSAVAAVQAGSRGV